MSTRNITLCCIDTANHVLAMESMKQTLSLMPFAKTVFITDRDDLTSPQWEIHKINRLKGFEDLNRFMLKNLYFHIDTEFCLIVQYDGFVWKPHNWSDEFLNYDYIGAPWPGSRDEFSVGTGGFSLRSKKLLKALMDDNIRMLPGINEDLLLGKWFRGYLQAQYGIKFPSKALAAKFACESLGSDPDTFGFHGMVYLMHLYGGEKADFLIDNLQPYGFMRLQTIALMLTYINCERQDVVKRFFKRVAEHYSREEAHKMLHAQDPAPNFAQLFEDYWPR
jgi:hypothetical protein